MSEVLARFEDGCYSKHACLSRQEYSRSSPQVDLPDSMSCDDRQVPTLAFHLVDDVYFKYLHPKQAWPIAIRTIKNLIDEGRTDHLTWVSDRATSHTQYARNLSDKVLGSSARGADSCAASIRSNALQACRCKSPWVLPRQMPHIAIEPAPLTDLYIIHRTISMLSVGHQASGMNVALRLQTAEPRAC